MSLFENQSSFSSVNPHHFPDPWLDMATMTMPRNLAQVLDLCDYIWLKNGTVRQALTRIVRYFITQVEFEGVSSEQAKNLKSFLSRRNIPTVLGLLGDDYMASANSFSSTILPFRRYLACAECPKRGSFTERPIWQTDWELDADFRFTAYCPACRRKTRHQRIDRMTKEEDRINVKRWAPKDIRLKHHEWSGDYEYYWIIPPFLRRDVQSRDRFTIEHMPWEVVTAARQDGVLLFEPGFIYHMREDTLAGVRARGWGIPRLMSSHSQAWYNQSLHRYNEALVMDYVMPFRLLTPDPVRGNQTGGMVGSDPLATLDFGEFVPKVMQMLREHRYDPNGWHILPTPVRYQALGGEANQLAPHELMNQGMDELLNGLGIPSNLYRFDFSNVQAMPTALRIFQQSWSQLVSGFNGFLEFFLTAVCLRMSWDKPEVVGLEPSRLADDLEARHVWLQLAASNQLSRRTAFGAWNIDAQEEKKRIYQEMIEEEEDRSQFEEDMAAKQMLREQIRQGGQMQPGQPVGPQMGVPGMPAGGMGTVTPGDLSSQADQLAQQWLGMPYEYRRTAMNAVRQQNEPLHALAKARMDRMRSQAGAEGKMMMQQQLQQGGVA